jgi:hypothetical protein
MKMPNINKQILEERAESLALVYLTRRDDLLVTRHPGFAGFDLLVSIQEQGDSNNRLFGVEVKGVSSEQALHRNNANWRRQISIMQQSGYGDIPVCLFVFVMESDQGYWKWVQEPVADTGRRDLIFSADTTLRRLDNTEPPKTEELTIIINAVNAWYDSRRTLVAA